MKFLVPNYSCLRNPWLGGSQPQIPVLSVLSWICWTFPEQNSWVCHCSSQYAGSAAPKSFHTKHYCHKCCLSPQPQPLCSICILPQTYPHWLPHLPPTHTGPPPASLQMAHQDFHMNFFTECSIALNVPITLPYFLNDERNDNSFTP